MKLTKLRIAGFKTFVEPAEFLIEPGLTGIVGPNGCGKSNLVEALRWVMGEDRQRIRALYKACKRAASEPGQQTRSELPTNRPLLSLSKDETLAARASR